MAHCIRSHFFIHSANVIFGKRNIRIFLALAVYISHVWDKEGKSQKIEKEINRLVESRIFFATASPSIFGYSMGISQCENLKLNRKTSHESTTTTTAKKTIKTLTQNKRKSL